MLLGTHHQPSIHLLINALGKVGGAGIIDRHYDHATQGATKKCGHPLGRGWPPQQDALALTYSAFFQFAGKAEGSLGHLPVGPAHGPVAAMLKVGTLPPSSQKIFEVFNHGAAFHTWDGIPSRVILSEVAVRAAKQPSSRRTPIARRNECDYGFCGHSSATRQHRSHRGPSTPHALRFPKCTLR